LRKDTDSFEGEVRTPRRQNLYLYPDGPIGDADRGWRLIVEDVDAGGQVIGSRDFYDETFLQILLYPPEYAAGPISWRWKATGEAVDLEELQPLFDVPSDAERHAVRTLRNPDDTARVYIGLYDDGSYRFSEETEIRVGDRRAWRRSDWSGGYSDPEMAEAAAREVVDWLARPAP
jgi:hypothetical protein